MNKIQHQIKEIEKLERNLIYYAHDVSKEAISKYSEILSIIDYSNNSQSRLPLISAISAPVHGLASAQKPSQ